VRSKSIAAADLNSSGTESKRSASVSGETRPAKQSCKGDSQTAASDKAKMAAEAAKAEGNKALQAKNYDEAVKKYTEAIAFDATQHTYFSNRAAAYMQLKDYERALQDAESCIKLNPTWAKGYSRKGAALHAMKKYDQADAAYHEGLAVAPGDASLKQGVVDVNKAKGAQQSQQNNPMAQAFGPNLIAKIAQDPNLRHKLGDEQFMMKLKLLQSNPQQMMSTMFQDPDMRVVGVCHTGVASRRWRRARAMRLRCRHRREQESDARAEKLTRTNAGPRSCPWP